jgi:hypothetical protein
MSQNVAECSVVIRESSQRVLSVSVATSQRVLSVSVATSQRVLSMSVATSQRVLSVSVATTAKLEVTMLSARLSAAMTSLQGCVATQRLIMRVSGTVLRRHTDLVGEGGGTKHEV